MGQAIDAGGHGFVGEAEGTGCEEVAAGGWVDEELKGSSGEGVFFSGDLLGVGELAGWGDEGGGLQDFDGPVVGEIEIGRHGFGLM